jgi:hypothetical protein
MAVIRFQLLHQADGEPARDTLGGSGLAFYGTSGGTSVQVGEYQDSTWVASADGSTYTDDTFNTKYVASTFPSGRLVLSGQHGTTDSIGLSGVKTFQGTIGIEFGHTTPVNVQNAQLRIYDRSNINNPASGVNTKVAEIVNHDGSGWYAQGEYGKTSLAVGSGDALWWGEPWPASLVGAAALGKNYFVNSNGVYFYNGVETENTNGDARLSAAAVAGSYDTVGGTGVIMPLWNSPGSGQGQIRREEVKDVDDGPVWPKWTQYIYDTSQQTTFFGVAANSFGEGHHADNLEKTYGGTGVDTHHTWSIALSAAPLSVGAKDQYGLYVSVEYL